MSYEELSLKGFVEELEDVSSGPHSRKFCFVIGAGASRTSGIKTGQELVDIWDKELANRNYDEYIRWKTEFDIKEENKYSFYSHYYEKRYKRNPSDGYNYLEKLMEHAKPSSGYIMLSYLLSKTDHNIVITTNFDHLIEDAIHYYMQMIPLVIGHESLAHYVTRKTKRPTIVKIHRDLLFDPANTVNQVESLHDNWKKAISNIFSDYHPIFIGYAGNDNSLMNYLVGNAEKFANGEWSCPYWMLYGNDRMDNKVSEFLHKSNGYFIKHSGFDEVLYLMGAAFSYQIPSKAVFIGDAEKRYIMLSDAIDAFTDKLTKNKETFPDEVSPDISQAVRQVTDGAVLQSMYRKAVTLHNEKKYSDALVEQKKLIELEPDNARYQNSIGITLHEMKRYDEALAAGRKAVELEPDNASYNYCLGVTLYEMKQYDEALATVRKAVELESDNASYHNCLGVTLHEMKRYDEAIAEKQKAIELKPDNASYHNNLGVTLHEMKRYAEALTEKQKAVELEPDNASYHNNLGVTLHEMKRYAEALPEKQKAVELEPDNARYLSNLGVTLHQMKRYDEALAAGQKAVGLMPDNASYNYCLSVTLYEMKRYAEALPIAQKAVELEPDNARYIRNLGVTLHEMKRYDEALAAGQKAVGLVPDNASYNYCLSVTLYEMKRYTEALPAAQKAVELEPGNARYHYCVGVTLHEMKRYDEALATIQKAVELEPDNVTYIGGLGVTLYRSGRYLEALNELNKAISRSSVLDRAYIYRGLAKIQLELENNSDQFEAAIEDLDMAIKICQTEARNYRDRAEGYLLINKLTEAENDLKKACKINDQDPETYSLYALLYEKRGDINKAKQYSQKAKTLGYIEPLQYELIS